MESVCLSINSKTSTRKPCKFAHQVPKVQADTPEARMAFMSEVAASMQILKAESDKYMTAMIAQSQK